jgi:hypothetical protein
MDGTFKALKYNSGMYIGEEAYDNLIYVLNKKSETNPDQSSMNFPNNVSANDSTIYTDVEQTAEFPGGVNAFRNKVSATFDGSSMNGDESVVKTEVTFVVEKDGTLSDVKATGINVNFNNEAARTIKSIINKWTPAKINGIPVRYRYRLPLTMNFEG